ANPILDTLLEPQKFDVREVAHALRPAQAVCRAEKPLGYGARVAFLLALLLRSAPVLAFRATDRRLSSAVENTRSVRRNPKDSGLEKLRAWQVIEYERLSHDSGPR